MQQKQFFYVANWKMNMKTESALPFIDQAKEWLQKHPQLGKRIIICPSYPLLLALKIELADAALYIGAQNCSEHSSGAYTGQVSAHDIVGVGADFCLIGHSECRTLLNESNEAIGIKATRLFEQRLNPIFCIGESAQEYHAGQTKTTIVKQLEPLIHAVLKTTERPSALMVAYEPIWAIGTGKIPDIQELQQLFAWLKEYLSLHIPTIQNMYLLYGGSVDSSNIATLKSVQGIDGFLIGGASLDFQKFKNIVGLE